MEKARIYRIIVSIFNFVTFCWFLIAIDSINNIDCLQLLEVMSIVAAYYPMKMNDCFEKDTYALFNILSISIIYAIVLLDFVYMFLQCCMDRLGDEPMVGNIILFNGIQINDMVGSKSIMYGYLSGVVLIVASILAFISVLSDCDDILIFSVVAGALSILSAVLHIVMARKGHKRMDNLEKTWPIRRGK